MAKRSGGLRFQPSGGERKAQVPVGKKQRLLVERMAHDYVEIYRNAAKGRLHALPAIPDRSGWSNGAAGKAT